MLGVYTLIHPVKRISTLEVLILATIILKILFFPLLWSYEFLAGPITHGMSLELGINLNALTIQNCSLCMENAYRISQFYQYKKSN